MDLHFGQAIVLLFAAVIAGGLNALAGGGSFISFPALLFMRIPAVEANATNTVALWPGLAASTVAYLKRLNAPLRVLVPVSYTHLDVYKRQTKSLHRITSPAPNLKPVLHSSANYTTFSRPDLAAMSSPKLDSGPTRCLSGRSVPLAAVALDSLFPYDVNASGRGHRTTDGASLLGQMCIRDSSQGRRGRVGCDVHHGDERRRARGGDGWTGGIARWY